MDPGNVDSVFVAGKARKLAGQLVGVEGEVGPSGRHASPHYRRWRAGSFG
jgi:hypothetical protein